MTEEDRFNELDRVTNEAVRKIQDARDWIDGISSDLTKDKPAWKQISKDCDGLVEDIDFQLGKEQKI